MSKAREITLREHLSRAGKAGTGAAKRRTPEQYAAIQAQALHARRVKAARRMLRAPSTPGERVWIAVAWGKDVLRDALALEG